MFAGRSLDDMAAISCIHRLGTVVLLGSVYAVGVLMYASLATSWQAVRKQVVSNPMWDGRIDFPQEFRTGQGDEREQSKVKPSPAINIVRGCPG